MEMGRDSLFVKLNKVVEIDGERFAVSLPDLSQLMDYSSLLHTEDFQQKLGNPRNQPSVLSSVFLDGHANIPTPGRILFCYAHGPLDVAHLDPFTPPLGYIDPKTWNDSEIQGEFIVKDNITFHWHDYGLLHWNNILHLLPWRPILIPLNKDGQFDKLAGADNPTGAITYGGTLYLGRKPLNIPIDRMDGNDSWSMLNHSFQDIWFGDTDPGKCLRWVWIDGILVSTDVLGMVSIKNLAEYGFAYSSIPY